MNKYFRNKICFHIFGLILTHVNCSSFLYFNLCVWNSGYQTKRDSETEINDSKLDLVSVGVVCWEFVGDNKKLFQRSYFLIEKYWWIPTVLLCCGYLKKYFKNIFCYFFFDNQLPLFQGRREQVKKKRKLFTCQQRQEKKTMRNAVVFFSSKAVKKVRLSVLILKFRFFVWCWKENKRRLEN